MTGLNVDLFQVLISLYSPFLHSAYRSPLCKSKRGGLKDTYPDDILAPVLKVCITSILRVFGRFYRNGKNIIALFKAEKHIYLRVKLFSISILRFLSHSDYFLVNFKSQSYP